METLWAVVLQALLQTRFLRKWILKNVSKLPYKYSTGFCRIPCVTATDREAIQLCICTCNGLGDAPVRMVRIANSLHIDTIMLSKAYYDDVKAGKYPGVEALDEPAPLEFDEEDNVVTPVRI